MTHYTNGRYLVSPIGRFRMTWDFIETVMGLWTDDINKIRWHGDAKPLIELAGQQYGEMRRHMNDGGYSR